jgi:hypothetical protein
MGKLLNLQKIKDSKKSKLIIEDITTIIYSIDLCIKVFSAFKKYSACQEILAVLKSNKKLLEIHLNKHKKLVTESVTND